MKKISGLLVVALFFALTLYGSRLSKPQEKENIEVNNELKVHVIDVGQGDSIFIELPNSETLLIDAGEKAYGQKVIDYIKNLGYEKIDYVVGTHPHTDHIGALATVIEEFPVSKIYLPKVVHNSKTYENLLLTIKNQGKSVYEALEGIKIIDSNNLKIYFLGPTAGEKSNLNNYSAILKIEFGDRKFLFMGDAEDAVESSLTDVSADVIKVGHHGSDTSSSTSFVSKVHALYAIISVGKDNQYKHPSNEIINRWIDIGAKVYRTDINGNIIIASDGNSLDITLEKGEE